MSDITRQDFKLSAPEYRQTPFESFGRLRAQGPIIPARFPMIGDVWLATTFAAVDEVLKKDKLFCRNADNAGRKKLKFERIMQFLMPNMYKRMAQNMIALDEPDHRRLRTLVDQAFQRQSITELRPRIAEIVDHQLDLVASLAAEQDGEVDLVEHLARPIPLAVITEVLGLPDSDRPKFKKWFSSFADVKFSLGGIAKLIPGLRKTMAYLKDQFEQVKGAPRKGLVSDLVHAEQEGNRLSEEELLSMVMLLLLAGHETTVHLINNCILTLLQLPDVRATLQDDPTKIAPAVEEVLRHGSPAQIAKPRFVTSDTTFHGTDLKRGDVIVPLLAAANYDPERFDSPEEFRIDRPQNYHLTFGAGPHVCLGLKLARAEAQIVVERLLDRWPNLEPSFDVKHPQWASRPGMRSPKSLVVNVPRKVRDHEELLV